MKKGPVKVSLIGKGENNFYQIRFPNIEIPVEVNEELYQKMLGSEKYVFKGSSWREERQISDAKEMLSV